MSVAAVRSPAEFEERLQRYLYERSEEGRAVRVGEKETSEQAAIVARYDDLFSKEQLELLRDCEERVLERVFALGELAVDDAFLAGEAQAGELLAVVSRRRFGPREGLELLTGEEIRVARDDRRLLGRLLLPHADRPRLLGALLEVRVEPLLECLRVECAHAATSAPRRNRASDVSRPSSSSDS